jgi:hypothetical protein
VRVSLSIPEGTVIHFDNTTRRMSRFNRDEWDWESGPELEKHPRSSGDQTWTMTEEGLRRSPEKPVTHK